VRQSAFRGLGMIVTFDFSLTDPSFLLDCSEKVCSALEENCPRNIAVNVTWALSNLCDALLLLYTDNATVFYADYPKHDIVRILATTTRYAMDSNASHMNIKVNSLRSIGCLLRICDETYFKDEQVCEPLLKIAMDGIEAISTNLSDSPIMKVRWNAAYAASKAIQNDHLGMKSNWHRSIMVALVNAIESCKNYKVKINAVAAILCVKRKELLQDQFSSIFGVLFQAIERAEEGQYVDDETKHKLDFIDNLGMAVAHLTVFINVHDLGNVLHHLPPDCVNNLRSSFVQVRKRLSPEKLSLFLIATAHLQELSNHTRAPIEPLISILKE
jgi:hypothetical protein